MVFLVGYIPVESKFYPMLLVILRPHRNVVVG